MTVPDEAAILACIPSLRRYARGLLGQREHADDLVQETLERAWSRYAGWRRQGDVRAWLFGILHNRFIDRLRAEASRSEDSVGDALPEVAQRPTQADRLELCDLDRILQRLPPEQREVLLLVGVEELSYQAVAEVIGVPIGTVMSRLSRGRERLRIELQGRSASPQAPRMQRVK
jgi:RNA polymerase sigma-70 factor (ECF subfamily)